MKVDYLIVGQGLSGTFLSYFLLNAGKKVVVIDQNNPLSASKVASGVINPVTGRRIVRTWRIEELLPFASEIYQQLEKELGVSLVKKLSLLDFHPSLQMKEAFEKRLREEQEFLHKNPSVHYDHFFNYHFSVGEISPCLLVDINLLLKKWREKLLLFHSLIEEEFISDEHEITEDFVTYKNIVANKIIFCDGVAGIDNHYFKNLPYAPNKGEVLIVKIPSLPTNHIYKQGISIVPWKEDLFWIGSSYDWNFSDTLPTAGFKNKISDQLRYWLKLPFEIVDHMASVRPANMERRPFVGVHPKIPAVAILNGMGTKGCSLAPFFAKQLSDFLAKGTAIYADAEVSRFEKILARKMN